ncbi:MAG: YsnF/AvaK domain-containing protein [Pseudorhodobacter sp.]|nr:YsnF/AvaK domain-containing protein [Pseudorhodobacter sp.]
MTYDQVTLSAFFDTNEDAEMAAARIAAEGIPRSDVRIVKGAETGTTTATTTGNEGGFWDSLADFFFPDEDRAVYAEGLRRGGYVLTVSVSEAQSARITDILDDLGAVDLDERVEDWQRGGWNSTTAMSDYRGSTGSTMGGSLGGTTSGSMGATTGRQMDLEGDLNRDGKVDVMEERLLVGKRVAQGGSVRVRTHVVEQPVTEDVTLRDERVTIKRTPVNRAADSATAFREGTISAEEHVEEAVVSKEARVVEEISLEKDVRTRTETVSDTVRKTEVEIEDDRDQATLRDTGKTQTGGY